jgi:hypothetical protein
MEWKEVEETLMRLLGPNYVNYPQCVEWNIKIMKYREKKKVEKIDNEN